jgi:filamentous hemagglutinin
VIPTNARAAAGLPDPAAFVELGGGDLSVISGRDISGGVYYVERGAAASKPAARSPPTPPARPRSAWSPTSTTRTPRASTRSPGCRPPCSSANPRSSVPPAATFCSVPSANPVPAAPGLNNKFWYKTYFNTFAPDAGVTATSLGGQITLRNSVTMPGRNTPQPVLRAWLESQNLLSNTNNSSAWSQPWLRLAETSVLPFNPVLSLGAPNLSVSALSGSINLAGSQTLFPAPTGQLEWVAAGGINALQPTGVTTTLVTGQSTRVWSAATVNLSDADPAAVPGALNPLSYFGQVGSATSANNSTRANFLASLAALFTESGSYTGANGVIQVKQARHSPGLPRAGDPHPARLIALGGDISGLTLFTAKPARVFAARDLPVTSRSPAPAPCRCSPAAISTSAPAATIPMAPAPASPPSATSATHTSRRWRGRRGRRGHRPAASLSASQLDFDNFIAGFVSHPEGQPALG